MIPTTNRPQEKKRFAKNKKKNKIKKYT